MKPIILGADVLAGESIVAGQFVAIDGTGFVKASGTAGTEKGVAESSQIVGNSQYVGKIGVVKQGLVSVPSVNDTYNWGDKVEVATGGQSVQALDKGTFVGTVAKTKTTTTDDNKVLIYINLA